MSLQNHTVFYPEFHVTQKTLMRTVDGVGGGEADAGQHGQAAVLDLLGLSLLGAHVHGVKGSALQTVDARGRLTRGDHTGRCWVHCPWW